MEHCKQIFNKTEELEHHLREDLKNAKGHVKSKIKDASDMGMRGK